MLYRFILGFSVALLVGTSAFADKPRKGGPSKDHLEPKQTIKKREEKANKAFQVGDHRKVEELLIGHLAEISKSSRVLLADSLHNQKKYTDEIRVLELTIKENESDYLVLTRIGDAYAELKKTDEATSSYRSAISSNRKYFPAYENLLFLFESTNNYYEAKIILKDMSKIFGAKKEFYHKLCRLDSLDGYIDSGLKNCLDAIYKDPDYPDSYVYLANNYRDAGEKVKAQKAYVEAAKKFQSSEFVQSAAGRYHLEIQDNHSAFKYFSQAVRSDPESVRALVGLAKSGLEIGEFKVSLDSFMKACKSDKSVTGEFRHAAAQLRVKRNYKWSGDFEAKSTLCRVDDR